LCTSSLQSRSIIDTDQDVRGNGVSYKSMMQVNFSIAAFSVIFVMLFSLIRIDLLVLVIATSTLDKAFSHAQAENIH